MGSLELRLRALDKGIDYGTPTCRCRCARLCEAVWVTAEAFPRCHECVNAIRAPRLLIEDRFTYLVLLLIWRKQGCCFGV